MNLLPKTEKDNLKKGLKLRFIVVALFLLSASFLIGFVMFLPSYFLASSYFSKATAENSFLGSKNDDSTKKVLDLPTEINSKLVFFQSNLKNNSLTDYFSKIVECLPEGVQLKSISYSKNQTGGKGSTIVVSGIAVSRDALMSFSTLLKETNLFTDVSVPVSSLTKDKNLPFSMNIIVEN